MIDALQPYAAASREQQPGGTLGNAVSFGEVTIEEYRGQVGNIKFVEDDKCHFFPVGAPDLFIEPYAPADYWDAVNTIALPRYHLSQQRSREAVLRQDLATMRESIDKFYGDNGKYPATLPLLVERRYLRGIPVDPITRTPVTFGAPKRLPLP